jgi:ComF family protein
VALLPPQTSAAAFLFQGPLADAIRRFKYAGRTELGPGLGRLLGEACSPFAGTIDRVVPIPLHPDKLRARGYNPAALLAREVAARLGAPLDCSLVRRVRATHVQAALPRSARASNVRRAFSVRPSVSKARVLLVDDVRTTGSTLSEAALALTEAGHTVTSLALAWAPA